MEGLSSREAAVSLWLLLLTAVFVTVLAVSLLHPRVRTVTVTRVKASPLSGLKRAPQFDTGPAKYPQLSMQVRCVHYQNRYLDPNRGPRPGDVYAVVCRAEVLG